MEYSYKIVLLSIGYNVLIDDIESYAYDEFMSDMYIISISDWNKEWMIGEQRQRIWLK